jgi:putative acetyltransferase
MVLRVEQAGDRAGIHAVVTSAFPTDAEARLVDRLRDAGDLSLSLVAVDPGSRIVAHIAFSPVTTARGDAGLGLAPLAVLPECQRCGIGSRLIREGLRRCREHGDGWIVVLGEPTYYARFGFEPAPRHGLHDEYGGGDAFQVLALQPGAVPRDAGLVRYAAAFASLDG